MPAVCVDVLTFRTLLPLSLPNPVSVYLLLLRSLARSLSIRAFNITAPPSPTDIAIVQIGFWLPVILILTVSRPPIPPSHLPRQIHGLIHIARVIDTCVQILADPVCDG